MEQEKQEYYVNGVTPELNATLPDHRPVGTAAYVAQATSNLGGRMFDYAERRSFRNELPRLLRVAASLLVGAVLCSLGLVVLGMGIMWSILVH